MTAGELQRLTPVPITWLAPEAYLEAKARFRIDEGDGENWSRGVINYKDIHTPDPNGDPFLTLLALHEIGHTETADQFDGFELRMAVLSDSANALVLTNEAVAWEWSLDAYESIIGPIPPAAMTRCLNSSLLSYGNTASQDSIDNSPAYRRVLRRMERGAL